MTANTIFELWRELLTEQGLGPQEAETLGGFRLGMTGENGRFLAFAKADEDRDLATFYSIAPFVIASDRRDELMRLVTRINFGLRVGCFELDLDDGELRLRTTVAFGKGRREPELLQQVLWANVATMDRWLPALVAAAQQGLRAQQAIALVEPRGS